MSELDLPSDADIARASDEWFACQSAGDPADWVEDLTLDWLRFGNYKAMWRFVLKLCADVPASDRKTIGMVGVGPLYDMVAWWPESTLTLIETEGHTNATLQRALRAVITSKQPVRERIDAIVARYERT
jgi:hypothetical protein